MASPTPIQILVDRILADPELERRFSTAASPADVMALANELEIEVGADDLAAHFSGSGDGAASELSASELERVTGGVANSGARLPVPPFWRPSRG